MTDKILIERVVLEQPQVEQEPVAWAVMQGGAICWEADYPFSNEPGWCDSDQQSVPLYTQPQLPRQPLTDEWIRMIYDECDAETGDEFIFAFARAIEFAHGITGDQT